MRADGGHEDGGNVRVDHGAAGADTVGGGSGGGSEHDAVRLDGGDELPAIVRLNLGQKRGGSAVDKHLVEDGIGVGGVTRATVSLGVSLLDHGALETHAESDGNAPLDVGHLLGAAAD